MKNVLTMIIDMSNSGRFSTSPSPEVKRSIESLIDLSDREGWEAMIDISVIDGLDGCELSMALFEIASCLEERGDAKSSLFAYMVKGIASDQDSFETNQISPNLSWSLVEIGWNRIKCSKNGMVIRDVGAMECPRCGVEILGDLDSLIGGVICEGCGSDVRVAGLSLRLMAENR